MKRNQKHGTFHYQEGVKSFGDLRYLCDLCGVLTPSYDSSDSVEHVFDDNCTLQWHTCEINSEGMWTTAVQKQ